MKSIFDKDFYPTPPEVIETMIGSLNIAGKVILEPSAGSGNIVDHLKALGAEVLACEKDPDLAKIVANKCNFLANDFFTVEAHQVSHINLIIMNPPFSQDEKHILHAWNLAPEGCTIVSLCNSSTVNDRQYYSSRRELGSIIDEYGSSIDLGDCFSNAQRPTKTEVSMITLNKPGGNYEAEFDGFFLEEDPAELQANALMPYNFVRDIVNRYIGAVKIYDEQLNSAVKLNGLLSGFYGESMAFQCNENGKPKMRNEFKKGLQKAAWSFVFQKMDLSRHSTAGLRADINKFVEQNQKIPFTMRNIYRMLDIVIGTTEQRMDKALLEVFERATKHYDDNRYNLPGWKTNSHFLLNRKFILPNLCPTDKWHTGSKIQSSYGSYFDLVEDMVKALCYITGDNYLKFGSLQNHIRYPYKLYFDGIVKYYTDDIHYGGAMAEKSKLEALGKKVEMETSNPQYGELFTWAYFEIRAYKKGTMHFTFKDADLWARFNQRIAKLLGYPLPETMKPKPASKPTAKQEPKAPAEAKPGNEPWRTTLAEFLKQFTNEKLKAAGKMAHQVIIRKAIADGHPVPAEVLADYPQLINPGAIVPVSENNPIEEPEIELELEDPDPDPEPELEEAVTDPNQLSIF